MPQHLIYSYNLGSYLIHSIDNVEVKLGELEFEYMY